MYFPNFGCVEYLIFIMSAQQLASNRHYFQFLEVHHTSVNENYVFVVPSIVRECGEIFINCPNCLFGTKVNNTFDAC